MRLMPNSLARRPLPAEHDLSGVIVDANGTEFLPGDQVFGFISMGEYTTHFKLFLPHQKLQMPLVKVRSHNMLEFPQIVWSLVLQMSLRLKLLVSLLLVKQHIKLL
jgi:hypothetical protein